MGYLFKDSSSNSFNPDLSNWNVSKVRGMQFMFDNVEGSSFNPDISK